MGLLKIENYFETKIGDLRKCRKGVEPFLDIESAPLFSERGQGESRRDTHCWRLFFTNR
jgi:hypothetical protein